MTTYRDEMTPEVLKQMCDNARCIVYKMMDIGKIRDLYSPTSGDSEECEAWDVSRFSTFIQCETFDSLRDPHWELFFTEAESARIIAEIDAAEAARLHAKALWVSVRDEFLTVMTICDNAR